MRLWFFLTVHGSGTKLADMKQLHAVVCISKDRATNNESRSNAVPTQRHMTNNLTNNDLTNNDKQSAHGGDQRTWNPPGGGGRASCSMNSIAVSPGTDNGMFSNLCLNVKNTFPRSYTWCMLSNNTCSSHSYNQWLSVQTKRDFRCWACELNWCGTELRGRRQFGTVLPSNFYTGWSLFNLT